MGGHPLERHETAAASSQQGGEFVGRGAQCLGVWPRNPVSPLAFGPKRASHRAALPLWRVGGRVAPPLRALVSHCFAHDRHTSGRSVVWTLFTPGAVVRSGSSARSRGREPIALAGAYGACSQFARVLSERRRNTPAGRVHKHTRPSSARSRGREPIALAGAYGACKQFARVLSENRRNTPAGRTHKHTRPGETVRSGASARSRGREPTALVGAYGACSQFAEDLSEIREC